jgi:hypothetical protein
MVQPLQPRDPDVRGLPSARGRAGAAGVRCPPTGLRARSPALGPRKRLPNWPRSRPWSRSRPGSVVATQVTEQPGTHPGRNREGAHPPDEL